MFDTVYVLERDAEECRWIESVLADHVRMLVFLDDAAALPDWLAMHGGDCLVCGAEPDGAAALDLVRRLRRRGERLPVLVLGPHSAFRSAVGVAQLEATDFIERPSSARRLRAALLDLTRNDSRAEARGARRDG